MVTKEKKPYKKHGLSAKQEKFAQNIAIFGMNKTDAYRDAYNTKTTNSPTIWSNACEQSKKSNVAARIQELSNEVKSELIATRAERMERLTDCLRTAENDKGVADWNLKIKATAELNKMDGNNKENNIWVMPDIKIEFANAPKKSED